MAEPYFRLNALSVQDECAVRDMKSGKCVRDHTGGVPAGPSCSYAEFAFNDDDYFVRRHRGEGWGRLRMMERAKSSNVCGTLQIKNLGIKKTVKSALRHGVIFRSILRSSVCT